MDDSSLLYVEQLPSPAVTIALTGQDSLLVYTYQNVLYHFIITTSSTAVGLVQVGQIALNGIVRAPARVRAVSWILPDHQLRKHSQAQQHLGADGERRGGPFPRCSTRFGNLPGRRQISPIAVLYKR